MAFRNQGPTGGGVAGPGAIDQTVDIGDSALVGAQGKYADASHRHAVPAPAAGYPRDLSSLANDGTETTPARSDHGHRHTAAMHLPGGHADVTPGLTALGFLAGNIFSTKGQLLSASAANTPVPLAAGSDGNVLTADSTQTLGLRWANQAAAVLLAWFLAKGDLLVGSASGSTTRLALGGDGQVLTADSTTGGGLRWATPAAGSGSATTAWYGDGVDGSATADGSASIAGISPAANVYTLTRDMYFANLTVNAGVTIACNNYRLNVNGTLTNNGTIHNNGKDASGVTAGTATALGTLSATKSGGTGTTNTGSSAASATASIGGAGAAGGAGSAGAGGSGGSLTVPTPQQGLPHSPGVATTAMSLCATGLVAYTGGGGGGGGGGDGTHAGGGGGAGGGLLVINAYAFVNNGTVSAHGGKGGDGVPGNTGSGSGGGGGCVLVNTASAVGGGGTMSAAAGAAGAPSGTGVSAAPAGAGIVQAVVWT